MRKRRVIEYGDDGGTSRTTIPVDNSKDNCSTLHRYVYDGDEDIESGPSRITIEDLEWMERRSERGNSSTTSNANTGRRIEPYSATPTTRRRRRIARIINIAAASLVLVPSVVAAPPIHRRDSPSSAQFLPSQSSYPHHIIPRQTPDSTSTHSSSTTSSYSAPQSQITEPQLRIDGESIEYDIKYLTSMSTPTQALPTDVYVVDEQRLPFYMTQDQNGEWVKVDNAWLLYGRQAGVSLFSTS